MKTSLYYNILGCLKNIFRHRHTGKLYAVKISKREGGGTDGMRDDEIQILIKFGQHPNIITVKVKILIRCINSKDFGF